MALGDRKILRFVSYSTLEKSPLSKVVKDKIERSRPIWGVGRFVLTLRQGCGDPSNVVGTLSDSTPFLFPENPWLSHTNRHPERNA